MTLEPLALVVEFHAAPGRIGDLRRALLDLTVATRAEEGCLRYDLHEDLEDPEALWFYEVWASPAAHVAHDATAHIAAFRELVPALLAAPPRLSRLRPIEPSGA